MKNVKPQSINGIYILFIFFHFVSLNLLKFTHEHKQSYYLPPLCYMFRASLLNKYWRLPPSPAWVSVRRSCDTYVILFIYVIQLHYLRRENKTCNTFSKFTVSGGVSQLLIYPVVSGGATTVFHINRTSERGKFSCLHSSFRLSMLSVFSM